MADATPLPEHIRAEIDEIQSRVWHLRSLIAAVAEATTGGAQGMLDDPEAAMAGLVDIADAIHMDLDAGALTKRAADRQLEEQEAAHVVNVAAHEVEIRAEQPPARIRGFLARTRLDINTTLGIEIAEQVDHGEALIEELALAFQIGVAELPTWSALDCADVSTFLAAIEPRPGRCFCNDVSDEPVNITCGFHEVLNHMAACLRELSEVTHG